MESHACQKGRPLYTLKLIGAVQAGLRKRNGSWKLVNFARTLSKIFLEKLYRA